MKLYIVLAVIACVAATGLWLKAPCDPPVKLQVLRAHTTHCLLMDELFRARILGKWAFEPPPEVRDLYLLGILEDIQRQNTKLRQLITEVQ